MQADFPEKVNRKRYSYEIYNDFLIHEAKVKKSMKQPYAFAEIFFANNPFLCN
jgi:hypothetical protein